MHKSDAETHTYQPRDEASRSQALRGVAGRRSVSFPSQGTRVIVITRDVPFRGNSHCVVEYDSLGNECPLGHAPKKACPRVKLISDTQLGLEHMCARRTREVQTIKPDKSVWGASQISWRGTPERRALEDAMPLSRMSPYGRR